MQACQAKFDFWFRALVSVVILIGCSVPARAQEAVPAQIAPFRAGFDALESTLMAKTKLAIDQLPRKLAVQKLADLHGIRVRLNEEALADAGVKLDAPVTASFRNFTLRAALFHVLGNDDLHFEPGINELIVGITPPNVPQALPPVRMIPVRGIHDAAQPGIRIRVMPTVLGPAVWAQINEAWIYCVPVQDAEVGEALQANGDAAHPNMLISFEPGAAGRIAFFRDRSALVAEDRLARLLDRRTDVVDRICRLSSAQREKLRLAGRGDIKRILDRAAAISNRLENPGPVRDAEEFEIWVRALFGLSEAVRLDLDGDLFDARSLFAKALKRTLTPEQSAAYSAGPVAEQ
jgi:hypothetical protein